VSLIFKIKLTMGDRCIIFTDIYTDKGATGIKFSTGVNDPGNKFAASVTENNKGSSTPEIEHLRKKSICNCKLLPNSVPVVGGRVTLPLLPSS
jgi:hypothetical protein